MSLERDKALYIKANKAYYNSKGTASLITDAEFDKLEAAIRKADPDWAPLHKTGVAVAKKVEVALEQPMPSLAKFYPDRIDKYLAKYKGPYVVMDKLDGSSVQLTYNKGVPTKLVTRGDGTRGGDISFLIPHLNIPRSIKNKSRLIFRCEAVVPIKTFKRKWSKEILGDKEGFENARAMANGMLNRILRSHKPHLGMTDIDIVVLGVYEVPIEHGLLLAKNWGFKIVRNEVVDNFDPTLLDSRIASSAYEMDGLVLAPADWIMEYVDSDKPKHIVAYKENEDLALAVVARVKSITWQTSPRRRLIPKVEIEATRIGGVTVNRATCHNAQWMLDRRIGPGALIKIVRGGEVIPKIVAVVKPGKLQLPTVPYELKGVHFVALDDSKESAVRALMKFFSTLGIEFIGQPTIAKLYSVGMRTAHDYMNMWVSGTTEHKLRKNGVGEAMTEKIWEQLEKAFSSGVTLKKLLVASNTFDAGVGERRLSQIEAACGPDILAALVKAKGSAAVLEILDDVPGIKDKTIKIIIQGLQEFRPWLREALKYIKVAKPEAPKTKKVVKGTLSGQRVSFTGYRDKAEEAAIEAAGGEVVNFGATTTILLYREIGKASSKLAKAKAKGIRVCGFKGLRI